jgi:hypothetical protein
LPTAPRGGSFSRAALMLTRAQEGYTMALHDERADPIATYRERFANLKRDFQLFENQIVISGTIGGNAFEQTLHLQQMVPEFGVLWLRSRRFWYGFNLFVVVSALSTWFKDKLEGFPAQFMLIGAICLIVYGLFCCVVYFRKVPAYRFVNEGGIYILDFIAAGPVREHARQFAEIVARTIRECKVRSQ